MEIYKIIIIKVETPKLQYALNKIFMQKKNKDLFTRELIYCC